MIFPITYRALLLYLPLQMIADGKSAALVKMYSWV